MSTVALDNTFDDPTRRAPLVLGDHDYGTVTDTICSIVERPEPTRAWKVGFAVSMALTGVLVFGAHESLPPGTDGLIEVAPRIFRRTEAV